MIRRSVKGAPKIKTPKVYSEDGFIFGSSEMLRFYKELKTLKEEGEIESFKLPQVGETKKSKYGAKSCLIDEHKFDSIMEGKFYIFLKREMKEGRVTSFELQPSYVLQEGFKKEGKSIRAITYIADYSVIYPDGREVIYDVKGQETEGFKIKRKIFDYKYRDKKLSLVQYRATLKRWVDTDEIKKKVKKGKTIE